MISIDTVRKSKTGSKIFLVFGRTHLNDYLHLGTCNLDLFTWLSAFVLLFPENLRTNQWYPLIQKGSQKMDRKFSLSSKEIFNPIQAQLSPSRSRIWGAERRFSSNLQRIKDHIFFFEKIGYGGKKIIGNHSVDEIKTRVVHYNTCL